MPRMFDYKLIMMLGLSIVVYFLYREIEHLNKRVSELEKTSSLSEIKSCRKQDVTMPSSKEQNDMKETINQVNNLMQDLENTNTIEEYSNEHDKIYSHDNLETNTNEQDSLMVDSLINMINIPQLNEDNHEISSHIKQSSEHNTEHDTEHNTEHNTEQKSEQKSEHNTEHNSENTVKKYTMDELSKLKLDELHNIANEKNININIDNGKRKKKADLAKEIFENQI